MKRLPIIIVFLLFCFSTSTYSQWGVKGGINLSDLNYGRSTVALTSFHVGGLHDFRLSEKWYFQPELQFIGVGINLIDDGFVSRGGHVKMYCLELPANFSYRPKIGSDMNLLVDLGLYARYGLFGNKLYKYYGYETIDTSPFDAYKRLGVGLNLGIGLQKKQYFWLASAQGSFTPAENTSSQLFVLKFSMGYKF